MTSANPNLPEVTDSANGRCLERPCSVENAIRQVIEKKLLAALDDADRVAILASKQDLDDLIWAIHRSLAQADWDKVRMERMYELLAGIRQLSSEAFPPNISS